MTPADLPSPPPRAVRFLERALHGDPAGPAILGDLHEDFVGMCRTRGVERARRWYRREALLLAAGRMVRAALNPPNGDPGMTSPSFLATLAKDVADAARTLRRAPGFALFTALVV
ncbi:MAG TPA: hypothetical protein VJ997_13855, partial [Longimicrobiales bacterium]|nr:hypothetical protein [Longimicrobiales bacterium]